MPMPYPSLGAPNQEEALKTAGNSRLFCAVVLFLLLNTFHARPASGPGQADPSAGPGCRPGDHPSAIVIVPGDIAYVPAQSSDPRATAPSDPAPAAAPPDYLAAAPPTPPQ